LLTLLAGLGIAALILPLFHGGAMLAAGVLIFFWLPTTVLAIILRATISLAWTLTVAVALGWALVLAFYVILADPAAWWLAALSKVKPLLTEAGLIGDEAALTAALEFLAPFGAGVFAANLLAYLLLALLLGRWWQSLLFNPGGFRAEFHGLRLGKPMAAVALLLFGLAVGLELPLIVNLALVLMVVYAVQGLAVIHGAAGRANLSRGWLVGLYVLMLLILPQLLVFLCALGIADAWADIRSRIRPRLTPP
jgi:hypothetical protein